MSEGRSFHGSPTTGGRRDGRAAPPASLPTTGPKVPSAAPSASVGPPSAQPAASTVGTQPFTGSGDKVIEFKIPENAAAIAKITNSGGENFVVESLDS